MHRNRRRLAVAASLAGLLAGALGIASPAQAAGGLCPGQVFTQPFAPLKDLKLYTLLPGGDFETVNGWTFYRGAKNSGTNAPAVLPGAGFGKSLYLPKYGAALSPPICITTDYPSLRLNVKGIYASSFDGLKVKIVYGSSAGGDLRVYSSATVKASYGTGWRTTDAMPTYAQWTKETQLRLYFYADGGSYNIDNVFIDPRSRT